MPTDRLIAAEGMFASPGLVRSVVFRTPLSEATPGLGLLPEERARTTTMSPTRLATFTAGRLAAAAALDELGVPRSPITIGQGGEPLWPGGVIGSITHSDEAAYAIVGLLETGDSSRPPLAVGIDAEQRGRIGDDLVPLVMTEAERQIWLELEPDAADVFATVTFSTKEALYKAQFPITRSWLGFEHIALENMRPVARRLAAANSTEAELSDEPASPLLTVPIERPIRSYSLVLAGEVLSGVVLRGRSFRRASPERSD